MPQTVDIEGHEIEVDNIGKVFFPEAGLTKKDLIDYYIEISKYILPHLKDRPITMKRFPDGIKKDGFYQKEVPDYFPDWVERIEIKEKENGIQKQVMVNKLATLVYLADQACIGPHTWLSRKNNLNKPDKMIFDLDPSTDEFIPVRDCAFDLNDLLEELDINCYVMTTGSTGIHVVVPLKPESCFEEVKDFCDNVADILSERFPEKYTTEKRKEKRNDRVFLDTARNSYGQTSVSPYAVRAKDGAPVATPLYWEDLDDSEIRSDRYTIKNIFRRLGQIEDPWKRYGEKSSALGALTKKLRESFDKISNYPQ